MRIKIPYLTTTPMQDLKITLALTPLWWLLGLYFVIYHFVVFLSVAKMVILRNKFGKQIIIPDLSKWLLIFLCIFLLSIFINSFVNEPQRTFAALNNFSVYFMGFLMIVVLYNSATYEDIVDFMKIAAYLAVIGGVLALVFLFLWINGYQNVMYTALTGILVPALKEYPYFDVLTNIRITATDYLFKTRLPRISVFTSVMTASGGQMLVLIPLLLGYWGIEREKGIKRFLLLSIPFSVLILSLARTPIFAMIAVLGVITFLSFKMSKRMIVALSIILLVIPISFIARDYVLEFANLVLEARAASTHTRFELYKEAVDIAMERNPIIGIGIKVREGFTKTAIGSHSTYTALFIMTGIVGVFSFLMFQFSVFMKWLKTRHKFTNKHRIIWLYFGASFLGLSLWRFTDTLDAVPYITFLYFLVTGVLISLGRISGENMQLDSKTD